MKTAIELNGVSKKYRRRQALSTISASIPIGSVAALIGANAAGKTTLLNLLTGVVLPSSGSISLLEEFQPGSRSALARVAYVAQDGTVLSGRKVRDAIAIARSMNRDFDSGFARTRLERIGISPDQRVSKMSGGERSQLAITMALARAPELLIMDEPLANLDPLARRNLLGELMAFAHESQATIVFSSHVIADVARVADYLVLIDRGGTVIADSIEKVLDHHKIFIGTLSEALLLTDGCGSVVTEQNREFVGPRVLRFDLMPNWTHLQDCSLEEVVYSYLDIAPQLGGAK
jgi:ABC-2 type transport system ATP-binding protein